MTIRLPVVEFPGLANYTSRSQPYSLASCRTFYADEFWMKRKYFFVPFFIQSLKKREERLHVAFFVLVLIAHHGGHKPIVRNQKGSP